jgi:hypothetical protein
VGASHCLERKLDRREVADLHWIVRSSTPVLLLALLASPSVRAGQVEVRVDAGAVEVRASGAPLSEVLDRISRQTGMRVIYDGLPAGSPVTAAIERPSATEAVMSLLEGQGLGYALVADPSGRGVSTLMVVSGSGAADSRTPPSAAVAPPEEASPSTEPTQVPTEAQMMAHSRRASRRRGPIGLDPAASGGEGSSTSPTSSSDAAAASPQAQENIDANAQEPARPLPFSSSPFSPSPFVTQPVAPPLAPMGIPPSAPASPSSERSAPQPSPSPQPDRR